MVGGLIFERFRDAQMWSGVVLVALAILGTLTSRGIDRVPAADPTRRFRANPLGLRWSQIRLIRRDRVLWLAVVGNTYFFFVAALMQQYNVIYERGRLFWKMPKRLLCPVTFMLATPTFIQAYIKRCEPQDFGSLEYVVTGAEKLPERVAVAFEDRFGIRPTEGYGCTECSPAVTVSTHDFRAAGFRQVGAKRGEIGHPLPGMSVRIVHPETGQLLPLGEAGLLHVSGPNIMKGYLGRPELTASVLLDGWYVTGDIAALDEDGFIEIQDRLSRFSKIGGEMVPHLKIEETLHELAEVTEQTFAVTGIPDEAKGERLAVLHTMQQEHLTSVLERLAKTGLPNLWIPRPAMFFKVEKLPYLGSGKLDLRQVREVARSASLQSAAA